MQALAKRIDQFSRATGAAIAWLTLAMVLLTFTIVVMRYGLDRGFIWMQEAVTWLHAAVFMLGAAFTLERNQHVRVDVFYREMSARRKAWVDLIGVVLLLAPLCVFFIWASWDYVVTSWQLKEASRQAQGLGYPSTSLLKSFLIIMPVMLLLQAASMACHAVVTLRNQE